MRALRENRNAGPAWAAGEILPGGVPGGRDAGEEAEGGADAALAVV